MNFRGNKEQFVFSSDMLFSKLKRYLSRKINDITSLTKAIDDIMILLKNVKITKKRGGKGKQEQDE